jgi:hypothetical protein
MPLAAAAALCKTQDAVLLVSGGWRQRDAPDPPVHETHTPLGSTRTRNSGTCTRLLATRCQNPAHSACSSMQRIRHSAFALLRRSAFGVRRVRVPLFPVGLLLAACLLLIAYCWLLAWHTAHSALRWAQAQAVHSTGPQGAGRLGADGPPVGFLLTQRVVVSDRERIGAPAPHPVDSLLSLPINPACTCSAGEH